MQRFLDFFIAFKEYVALTIYIALSLTMIAISKNSDVEPLRAFATGLVGAIQSTYAWIPNPITLRRENQELQSKSIELAAEVGKLRRADAENIELRRLLGIAPHPQWKLVPAEVVGKTASFQRNMMTINLGANDSMMVGMAVITDAGLVGRIFSVSQHFALVQMLSNTDLRIACKIARTRVEGIIEWDGASTLSLENIPKALDVQLGDLIVTSEYSQYFPADVPIGTIIRLAPQPNSLFRRVTVEAAVNLSRVEHVYVILKNSSLEQERVRLENGALKSIPSKNLLKSAPKSNATPPAASPKPSTPTKKTVKP